MLRPGASQPWKSWLSSGLPASRHLRNLLPCPRASWLRSLRHHSGSIGKGKDGIEVQGTSESKQAALDLLDKLFPPTRAPPDRVNRPINNNTPPSRHELGHGRSEDIDEPRRRLTIVQRLHDETSGSQEDRDFVLIMVNASLNLLPEDFRSLMPKGRHIEEWNLDQGDIVKSTSRYSVKSPTDSGQSYLVGTHTHSTGSMYTISSSSLPSPPLYTKNEPCVSLASHGQRLRIPRLCRANIRSTARISMIW